MTPTPYRTLIFAEIVQESALSVGGNQPHGLVDSPLSRDGKNRPVLRGSTLAGCFIASARSIVGKLPLAITDDDSKKGSNQNLVPSAWRFSHAHPMVERSTEFFQHVSIDAKTGAAKDDHLFDLEALPMGTRWNFLLEIVPSSETLFDKLESLAALVLLEWAKKGGARLGRGTRHGYGWCHLENIQIARLDVSRAGLYPNALKAGQSAENWIADFRSKGVPVLDLPAFQALHSSALPQSATKTVIELSGTLQVGERQDEFGKGYGVDTLSIGGHARVALQIDDFFDRVIKPKGILFPEEDFDPDFAITAMSDADGKLTPYVPGASIRGVWRSTLERHLRATNQDTALSQMLFGSTEEAGALSIANATLQDNDWQLFWQQHVAIDELSGGAYESSKFNRLSLARAVFHWRARIEADTSENAKKMEGTIKEMIERLGEGHLPVGGGVWRGHGHICWTLDQGASA